ncbi:thiamine pyrophosphate-binding protein [Nocardia sp. CA2R105]|uniref:thiamine pyrophosphate-binding protein n=1 Tax=Nocardia coffeae TaxID=2873381 RepID=UPI001CA77F36|nr:thiamine pyrophosphate-binding protein [Nocardia coffeae]MBY8857005.1 thiamine pyrophosphate-binding protein [Nocardia coffeae]
MSANRYLAEALKAAGTTHYFHVPVSIPGALKEMSRLGVTPVMTHGEKAAAYMADGFARVSGRPGVCGAQIIGATNLAAGLRDAYMARIPVVAITGGTRPDWQYRLQYQEIDDRLVYDSVTKFNVNVWGPERLPDLLVSAFRAATTGAPQPVHLELSGIGGEVALAGNVRADPAALKDYSRYPSMRPAAEQDSVASAGAALSAAVRPVMVVGGGAKSSGARAEVVALAQRLQMPVALGLNAKGTYPERDPLYLGIVGEYSSEAANRAVCEADLVFYVGSQTGGMITRSWSVPPIESRVIHLDIDPQNIGRNYPDTLALCGDARTVLRQLLAVVEGVVDRRSWLARTEELKVAWSTRISATEGSEAIPLLPQRLAREISNALPADAILVGDTGHTGAWLAQNVHATHDEQTFIRAHGSLGWAFPASIGAKCAAPDRTVICFTGDGGMYYHLSELETAVRYGINVVVVVNNNSSYSQEQPLWEGKEEYEKNWKLVSADFVAVAEAFGCLGRRVENPDDIGEALTWAVEARQPVVLDVRSEMSALSIPSWDSSGSSGMYDIA